MSRLFISLYLDEDVSALVAKLVRSRAFAAATTQESGQSGKSDADQLAFATARQMAIVTHNRVHFEELAHQYIASGESHSGIIVAVRRPPYDIAGRLLRILNGMTAEEMDNLLLYV